MRDPFAGYDAWLERPYQDMMEESDRFYAWCEEAGVDPDDPEADRLYADAMDSDANVEYYDFEDDEDW